MTTKNRGFGSQPQPWGQICPLVHAMLAFRITKS